ncbi:MAG: bifunctional phosphopantothenoylcysteine decarboxylase/phosphopantothenate--cysteine ligase CoaBC [Proteobacteria bacterium]|nr:bifunctional phosphopantothenoylcysteine decarboxylase/phosphopantothenate--cysteine ligase CoaBC [Pseudomonadota bacterium]
MQYLNNFRIILGITGGIAAYKSAELVRLLRKSGAQVRVVMTKGAQAFITPLTLQALSGHKVHDDLLDVETEAAMGHIELARWADAVVIAPASANFIAKLAHGLADDLLSTLCLATQAPIAIAPAMNQQMWHNIATQENLKCLQERGIKQFGPDAGEQACGDIGLGRLLEPTDLLLAITGLFKTGDLSNKSVLITAGPTHEIIDPVRFITNHSSGKMGFALAEAARDAGANVTLITGPVSLATPPGIDRINVTNASEMFDAVMEHIDHADVFIANAAVSDYRCEQIASQKLKKSSERVTLNLIPNPDILSEVANRTKKPFCVGFAAETEKIIEHAEQKLKNKSCDMIVANLVNEEGIGFGSDHNAVTVITPKEKFEISKSSKKQIARQLIQLITKGINHE